jgi:hypothetical protein
MGRALDRRLMFNQGSASALPIALLIALFAGALIGGCAGGPPGVSTTITPCMAPTEADSRDVQRNLARIRRTPLCYRLQRVQEDRFHWTFHILEHRGHPDGPFWVLPHDDENSAFDVAVQAVIDYGGGLLAVDSDGQRRFQGQDPNRNFSGSRSEAARCRGQRASAPGYTAAVLEPYRGRRSPILALHNNHDGWHGNGGRGNISLYLPSPTLRSFPGSGSGPLSDEDNLVFMAGRRPPHRDQHALVQIQALNAAGLNVVYKTVDARSFDCSLSDYVAWHRRGDYYNLEAEHGARRAQSEMVERLLAAIGIRPLKRQSLSPFLEP